MNLFAHPQQPRSRSGVVLLLVLAILGLLSVMAIGFVSMAKLERSMSRNYVDRTRAVLAAESGVEYAMGRIYGLKGGALRGDELRDLTFVPAPDSDALARALKASFQMEGVTERPISGQVSDSYRPGGDYFILKVEDESGKLNLNDSNGTWNIDTDPLPDGGPDDSETTAPPGRLYKIVEALADNLFGPGAGVPVASALFDEDPQITRSRPNLPGGRFSDVAQVKAALTLGYDKLGIPAALSESEFEKFQRHVTLHGWQDPDVLRPTFQLEISKPDTVDLNDPDYFDYRFNVYLYRDMQTRRYELEPRCPVNVNTCSLELLEAMIAPVQGWYLYEGKPSDLMNASYGSPFVKALRATSFSVEDVWRDVGKRDAFLWTWASPDGAGSTLENRTRFGEARLTRTFADVDPDLAGYIAEALYERIHDEIDPRPFQTWDEFTRFLYQLVDPTVQISPELSGADEAERMPYRIGADCNYSGDDFDLSIPGFDRYQADALLANFNPNSMLNDFNPDMHLFRHVDKAQLTRYTGEFSLQPTGFFRFRSLGRVTTSEDTAVAEYEIQTDQRLFYLLRQTTQKQFMTGEDQNDSIGYDLNNHDSLYALFAETASFVPTGGCDLMQDGLSIAPGGKSGPSLISYPEPIRMEGSLCMEDHPLGQQQYFSAYDGSIMLSTHQFTAKHVVRELEDTPMMLAPMGYRWVPDSMKGAGWKARSLAAGGLIPSLHGQNPDRLSDDIGDIDHEGGRGVMLTYGDDWTVSSDNPNPAWDPSSWRPRPDPDWRHDAPWVDHRHWKTVSIKYGDHDAFGPPFNLYWVGPDQEPNPDRPPPTRPGETVNRVAWNTPSENPLTPDMSGGQVPGNLYVDGGYSEPGRLLSYRSTNLGSNYGTEGSILFWVKPNWDAGFSNRPRQFFSVGHMGGLYTHPLDLFYLPVHARPMDETTVLYTNVGVAWPFPTHSFLSGWMWMSCFDTTDGIILDANCHSPSATATDFFPGRVPGYRNDHPSIGFYGRQWNLMAISYNNNDCWTPDHIEYMINDVVIPTPIYPWFEEESMKSFQPIPTHDLIWEDQTDHVSCIYPYGHINGILEPDLNHIGQGYMRLGWCEENGGMVSDATYDDIMTFGSCVDLINYQSTWNFGRYQSTPMGSTETCVGYYTSTEIPLLASMDRGTGQSKALRLHSVNWTLWWPRYQWRPEGDSDSSDWRNWGSKDEFVGGVRGRDMTPAGDDQELDPVTGAIDPITVDIRRADGTWVYNESLASPLEDFSHMLKYAPGSGVQPANALLYKAGDTMQYRVYFHLDDIQALFESPTFDDITFVFIADKPEILSWNVISE